MLFRILRIFFSKKPILKYKILENGPSPKEQYNDSAGIDLPAYSITPLGNNVYQIHTNISVEIPKGYIGLLLFRSGSFSRFILEHPGIFAHPGIIDADYRGEILFKIKLSDSIAPFILSQLDPYPLQLVLLPFLQVDLKKVKNLSQTQRGEKGFGSTNNN